MKFKILNLYRKFVSWIKQKFYPKSSLDLPFIPTTITTFTNLFKTCTSLTSYPKIDYGFIPLQPLPQNIDDTKLRRWENDDEDDWEEEYELPQIFQWQLTSEFSIVPRKASDGAAGFDIYAIQEQVLKAKTRAYIPTGVSMAIPVGYVGQIWPRSGKAGLGIDTSAGIIDPDYRGELKVLLVNDSNEDFQILRGDRIAQLLIVKTLSPKIEFTVVDLLNNTERGSNGFGSTGR